MIIGVSPVLNRVDKHVWSAQNRQKFEQQDQGQAQKDERDRNLDQDKFQKLFQGKLLKNQQEKQTCLFY